nr:MAG TPA_asm: hypothetical protein [Caudoviricetes sp.]
MNIRRSARYASPAPWYEKCAVSASIPAHIPAVIVTKLPEKQETN